MSAPIDTLLSRLDGVRKSGKGYMAKCPAHADKSPSLAIAGGDDGRVLIHCFAACAVSDVLAAVGMDIHDLFPERLPEHRYGPRKLGVSSFDVLRAVRSEARILTIIASDAFAQGASDPELCRRAALAADRINTALELCDG
jgi:hypothetical protein